MFQGRLSVTLPPALPDGDCHTPIPTGGCVYGWYYRCNHPHPFMIIQGIEGECALVWLGEDDGATAAGNYIAGNPIGGPSFTPDQLKHLVELALADLTKNL